MLVPLHLDNSEVRLFPVVCVAVAVVCIAVHIGVVATAPSMAEVQAKIEGYEQALLDHPEASLPARCKPFARGPIPASRNTVVVEVERACAAALDAIQPAAYRRYGLVPSKGLSQIGFLTSMFLHGGWMHLIGNLLFLYIVGPFLEDRWGRGFFAAFFVVGGVISGLTQALMDAASTRPIIGASGAIAACMGAFTILFWRRRVFVLLWLGIFVRKFYMPAWLWGGLWIAGELLSYGISGLDSPVAVLVHIGGFFFGVAVAVGASKSGLDKKLDAAVEQSITHEAAQHRAVAEAEAAFAREDWAACAAAWSKVIKDEPKNAPALYAATRAYIYAGDRTRAAACFDRFVDLCVQDKDTAAVHEAFRNLAPFGPGDLRPALCSRLAPLLVDDKPLAASLWLRAAHGAAGSKAGIAAAERAAALFTELNDRAGIEQAHAAMGSSAPPPPSNAPSSSLELARPSASQAARAQNSPPVTTTPTTPRESPWVIVHDAAVRADGLMLEVPAPKLIRFDEVATIGAAAIAGVLLMDISTHRGERFRLAPTALAGLANGDVDDARLSAMALQLLAKTQARSWPSRPALAQATWPRVDTVEQLDAMIDAGLR